MKGARVRFVPVLLAALLAGALPARAHHPGEQLDEVMAEKEPAFEPTDLWRLPDAGLRAADGSPLDLGDLEDRIVVLSFVPEGCGKPCADQQALLHEVQKSINVTPMREMVLFVTLGRRDVTDTGWEAVNWRPAAPADGTPVAEIAETFAALSGRGSDAAMVHIVDRGGRHAGIFHGTGFGKINMVLYINGLTNAHPAKHGWLDRILGAFE